MANKKVSPLTDTEIKNAKPKDKKYTLSDGNGLQLLIKPDGKKIWEIRYTIDGKPKATTAGTYPTVSLKQAREKRDELKVKVSTGVDPIQEKKEIKAIVKLEEEKIEALENMQFHKIAYEWLSTLTVVEVTAIKKKRDFERDIFPYFCTYDENHNLISSKQIGEITHGELMRAITQKAKTTADTAKRLFADCVRLWTYAVSHEYADINITHKIDKSVVPKTEKKNFAKITDEKILGELLRAIEVYKGDGGIIVKNVLRFVTLLPLRAENLCTLKWESVNFEKAIITIPRSEMKVKNKNLSDFILPLPHQAVSILKEIQAITGWGVWVFHGARNNKVHVNKESGNKALRIMGFVDEVNGRKQTLHSFRGTFRSLTETYATQHKASFEVRERCIDHNERNEAVRAYTHKADYTEQMRELLQWWADYLDGVKKA
ncbi:MAG: integrase arm-type DNA-binding domain-containing protein [Campylobacterales bacterium]|nr:integrase arm-type DNA-binding domain-containing protein [Campylobacterales bacterium]